MANLESLKIKNFRGFDSLEIEGLSKINLFVGKNNSGKTSILEALFLLFGMSNPDLPNRINTFRDLNISSPKQLGYLFHNLKIENKPAFHGKFKNLSERWLEIHAITQQNIDPVIMDSSSSSPEIAGIKFNFSVKNTPDKQKQSYASSLYFENNQIKQDLPQGYNENLIACLVHPGNNDAATLAMYKELVKRKKEAFLLDSMKAFDNKINNLQPLDGIFVDLEGVEELVPSNILGDGTRKFLNIMTAVCAIARPSLVPFVCIDEIEDGLHYSAHKLLWHRLITFAKDNNIQLFITTHNIETLTCLKSVLEETQYEPMQEEVKVFTVAKTLKAGFQTYRYSFESFKNAIERDTELRS